MKRATSNDIDSAIALVENLQCKHCQDDWCRWTPETAMRQSQMQICSLSSRRMTWSRHMRMQGTMQQMLLFSDLEMSKVCVVC